MNSVRLNIETDFFADRFIVSCLDHPLETADIDDNFKVYTLECNRSYFTCENAVFNRNNINILGTYNNVNRFTAAEALIETLELST
jgi:hypothetical protein